MIRHIVVVASAAALLAGPVWAADPPAATTQQSTQAKTKPTKEKRICEERLKTGSKIPRMFCRTVSQVEDEQYNGQKIREQFRNEGPTPYPAAH